MRVTMVGIPRTDGNHVEGARKVITLKGQGNQKFQLLVLP